MNAHRVGRARLAFQSGWHTLAVAATASAAACYLVAGSAGDLELIAWLLALA
jgi:hypothetical protein